MHSKVKDKINVNRSSSELIYVCYSVVYMVVEELGGAKGDNYACVFLFYFFIQKK